MGLRGRVGVRGGDGRSDKSPTSVISSQMGKSGITLDRCLVGRCRGKGRGKEKGLCCGCGCGCFGDGLCLLRASLPEGVEVTRKGSERLAGGSGG